MRPAGAILFGEMGDRIFGRKHALVFSIILITVPSILMGCLPTYATWGVFSTILLVILRMLQGLSVGGQLAGSYVLSIEQSSSRTRGFRGSVCDASSVWFECILWGNFWTAGYIGLTRNAIFFFTLQVGGFLLASAVTTITRSIFSEEQVNEWAWRCPFLFSILLAPALYKIVSNTEESKYWSEKSEQKETEQLIRESENADRPAVFDLFSSPFRRRQLAGMIGVLGSVSASFYTLFLWTPVYLSELRGLMSEKEADMLNFCVVGTHIFFLLLAGKLSDSFPHRKDLVCIGLPGMLFAAPTMFGMFESESWFGYLVAQLQFGFCLALVQGSMASWEVELWMADPTLSFTGVAIGHNIASTVFGGTMPLVATFLFYRANEIDVGEDALWPHLLPGLYISLLSLMSLYCVSKVVRHPHDVRTGDSKLREAVIRENQKYKKSRKDKEKRRRMLEKQLNAGNFDATTPYVPPSL